MLGSDCAHFRVCANVTRLTDPSAFVRELRYLLGIIPEQDQIRIKAKLTLL
jgi:hypothetical protein